MEFAIAIPQTYPDPVRLQRFLKRAEDLPFDAVWCIEQVIGTAPVLESVTTLTYAAEITQRLRLGIAVLLIAQRNPIDLAKSLSSLDVLSNGRLIIGVGLGQSTRFYPAYGLAPEGRVARFRENLAVMKAPLDRRQGDAGRSLLTPRRHTDGAESWRTSSNCHTLSEGKAPLPSVGR